MKNGRVLMSAGQFEGSKGEVNDVFHLIACMKDLPFVDAARNGMIGGSHGGGITALALSRVDGIKAGISCAGVLNPFRWHYQYEEEGKPAFYVKANFEQQMAFMQERSALHVAQFIRAPVLIIVGDADMPPIFKMNLDFINRLTALGKNYRHKIYPKEVHGFYFGHPQKPILPESEWKRDAEDAYRLMVRFLRDHLR